MGFLDWLFGSKQCCDGDERLKAALERVIEGIDPRLKNVGNVRERLAPAVAHALDYARQAVAPIPPCIEMTPETWAQNRILRAMFVRPVDVANTLANSPDLREFLGSAQARGIATVHCVVAATRVERTIFGVALEGDVLRQDIAQKSVGFNDFRLVGFAPSEALLRTRIEEIVLEGLVLSALRDVAEDQQRSKQLSAYRQLLLTRLRLMEQSGVGLDAMLESHLENHSHDGRDLGWLRRQLAENEAELATLQSAGTGVDATLERVIEALHNAESVTQAQQLSLRLDSMNILVGAEVADAAQIELIEFSTANPDRPRRVAFLASFPRQAVVERRIDFDAMLQTL